MAADDTAERLARAWWDALPGSRWPQASPSVRAEWIDAAQSLIDSPEWEIRWVAPDPAEQIAEAWPVIRKALRCYVGEMHDLADQYDASDRPDDAAHAVTAADRAQQAFASIPAALAAYEEATR